MPKIAARELSLAELEAARERELLLRHRRGDPDAFSELLTRYRARVYSILVRMGVPEAVRDDLFQEVFTAIHRKVSSYRPELPARPWIVAIVTNRARDYFRANSRREQPAESAPERADEHGGDIHGEHTARETAEWLEDEIQKLPPDQRQALLMCGIEGIEQREAAEALEMPVNTVKTNLRRAREALLKALKRRNLAIEREVKR
jgi:RNA polymerase sigma-70 factor (ECF subfamily)